MLTLSITRYPRTSHAIRRYNRFFGFHALFDSMHPEKMASLILIAMAVLFIIVAVIFQSQDIGSCPLFIPGQQDYTCTIYYPGTNIPIEPTVRILVTLTRHCLWSGSL